MTRWQIVSFSILHFFATLSIPLLAFLLGGCLEPELQNKPGPPVPCPDIQKALNDSIAGPWTFDVGQFVHIQDTAAPVNQAPSVLRDVTQLILSSTTEPDGTSMRIQKTVVKEGSTNASEVPDFWPSSFVLCDSESQDTFHNFTVTKAKVAVPRPQGEACDSRFPNCEMEVNHFRFDKILREESGEQLPLHILITTSHQVPYLARLVQFCVTEPLETNGPTIPVTQCSTVRNFRFKAP